MTTKETSTLTTVLYTTTVLVITSTLFIKSYSVSMVKAAAEHIVISEIKLAGDTATDEFVELYNPTNTTVPLDGWRLTKKTSSGTESNLVSSLEGSIPAYGYFLIAHPNSTVSNPDITYSASSNSLTSNNTVVLYSDSGETVVDKVGMGEASDKESQTALVPDTGTSLERKAFASSTSESMITGVDKERGNSEDTNNNASDFVLRETPEPQTSNSPLEQPNNGSSPTVTQSPSVSPTVTITPTTTPTNNHIVISEVQFSGNTSDDEFIELYNPNNSTVDLTDWRIRRKTATGTSQSNIVSSIEGTIPAYGYFLIAPEEYEGETNPDQAYSTSTRLTANNVVYLYKPTEEDYELVDKVGTGEADDSETTTTTSPETGASIERKANQNSTTDSMTDGSDKLKGNGYDTDNNENDFISRTTSEPQNSLITETPEIGSTPTPTATPTATSSPTTTPTATPTSSPAPTNTSTPTETPVPTMTPSPTPTPEFPDGHTIALFPLGAIACRVEYRPMRFGRWFTLYVPRIHCSHIDL